MINNRIDAWKTDVYNFEIGSLRNQDDDAEDNVA